MIADAKRKEAFALMVKAASFALATKKQATLYSALLQMRSLDEEIWFNTTNGIGLGILCQCPHAPGQRLGHGNESGRSSSDD